MEESKAALLRLLFKLGAIKFGAFRLKLHDEHPEAPLSPIYIDLRTADHPKKPGPLTAEAVSAIVSLMLDQLVEGRLEYDCFVGIPDAGEPFAEDLERAASWSRTPRQRLRLFKEFLPDGTRRISPNVAGKFKRGDRTLVMDDLITQADSKLEAIATLEAFGFTIKHVVVLVDRQQGGKEQLREKGYELIAIFTLDELLDFYVSEKYITKDIAEKVRGYIADNRI